VRVCRRDITACEGTLRAAQVGQAAQARLCRVVGMTARTSIVRKDYLQLLGKETVLREFGHEGAESQWSLDRISLWVLRFDSIFDAAIYRLDGIGIRELPIKCGLKQVREPLKRPIVQ